MRGQQFEQKIIIVFFLKKGQRTKHTTQLNLYPALEIFP
jgi:hypothetical protein